MVFSSEKIVPGTRVDYSEPIVFDRKVSTFIDRRSAVASQAIEPGVSGGSLFCSCRRCRRSSKASALSVESSGDSVEAGSRGIQSQRASQPQIW